MMDLPRWITESFKKNTYSCPKCQSLFNEKHIKGVGVKYSFQKPTKEVLFVDLFCLKCGKITMFEIKFIGLVEFALDILDEMQAQAEEDPKNQKKHETDFDNDEDDYEEEDDFEEENTKSVAKKEKEDKSCITLKDIKDSAKFLQKTKTHTDFLEEIGLTPEEIYKYSINTEDNK